MILTFISSFYREYVRRSGNNLFEHEKVFQTIGIVLTTEQSIKSFTFISQAFCFNFKSTFTIFYKFMTFGTILGEYLMMAASANVLYIVIDYKKIPYMKVAAGNINIRMHQLFSK